MEHLNGTVALLVVLCQQIIAMHSINSYTRISFEEFSKYPPNFCKTLILCSLIFFWKPRNKLFEERLTYCYDFILGRLGKLIFAHNGRPVS